MMNEENNMKDLARLVEQGYKWIARDKDGQLFVYDKKPTKDYSGFYTENFIEVDEKLCPFITFDNSPFEIVDAGYGEVKIFSDTFSHYVKVYDKFDVIKSMTNTIRDSFNFVMNGTAFASGNIGHYYVDEFNLMPKKIVYNAKLGRTTLVYNNNYVVRSEATKGDLKNSTLELGIYIALLKSLELERLNHIINYTWTNFKTSKQKEIYLSGILHTELQGYGVSRNQLDKIVKSLKDNKDKVIINVDNKDYHIELEYKLEKEGNKNE